LDGRLFDEEVEVGLRQVGCAGAWRRARNDVREDRDPNGDGDLFGGARGGVQIADAPGELEADARSVVQFSLQDADGGVLLHGVEDDHSRRPAADFEEAEGFSHGFGCI